MDNTDLKFKLQLLLTELKQNLIDSRKCRTIIETLLKIFRNVVAYPDDKKYREMKVVKLQAHFWNISEARKFFLFAGWEQKGEHVFLVDDRNVKLAIDTLVENRVLNPSETCFKYAPVEGPGRQVELEMELKKLALAERDKALQECLHDKQKRKELAETIKQELIADQKRRQLLYTRRSSK